MKWSSALLVFALGVAGAGWPWTADAAQSARRISIEYRGPLRDALRKIAADGGINLVVSGEMNEDAEVYLRLKAVTPEEALRTVASAHHLRIDQSGSIWTVRPMTEQERASESAMPPPPDTSAPRDSEPPSDKPAPPASSDDAEAAASARAAKEAAEALAASPADDHRRGVDTKRLKQNLKQLQKDLRRHRVRANDRVVQGSMVIEENETIHNATTIGGSLTVNGNTTGDAVALGGSLTVNGHIGGNAVAMGGSIHLGPKAVVDGDVAAVGGEVSKEEGAEIGGNQTSSSALANFGLKNLIDEMKSQDRHEHSSFPRFAAPGFFLRYAFFFIVAFFFAVFLPARMRQVEQELEAQPVLCGLTGLVAVVALAPVCIFLVFIPILGWLTLPVVVVLALAAAAMSLAAITQEIGMRLPFFRGKRTQALVLAMGALVLTIVSEIWFLGPLALLLAVTLAFGAVVRTRFGQMPKGVPQPI
jgi:hypothetical protein